IRDALAAVAHRQRLAVVALPLAHLARHEDVRQEVHLHLDLTVPRAGLAAAALHVEREAPRCEAPRARVGERGEDVADLVERLGVGARVAAWRAPDGPLVDGDDLVDGAE